MSRLTTGMPTDTRRDWTTRVTAAAQTRRVTVGIVRRAEITTRNTAHERNTRICIVMASGLDTRLDSPMGSDMAGRAAVLVGFRGQSEGSPPILPAGTQPAVGSFAESVLQGTRAGRARTRRRGP